MKRAPDVKDINLEFAALNPPSHMKIDLQKARRAENLAAIGTFGALLVIDAAFVPGIIRNAITPIHIGFAFLSESGVLITGLALQARCAFNTERWQRDIWIVESIRKNYGIPDPPY